MILKKSQLKSLPLLLVAAAAGTGCTMMGNFVKSELSAYAEPTTGELAHVRLVGSRNVKVYPASTCPSVYVPGSGYPAGPQMGGQRKRDLGMPKTGHEPKHFVEIAARGDEPITTAFQIGRYKGQWQQSCYVANTFVPQTGRNYEVTATWMGDRCVAAVYEIVKGAAGYQRSRVPTATATCPQTEPAADA